MKFTNNYLEELPVDIQLKIIDIVNIEQKKELDYVKEINNKINNMGYYIENDDEDISFIKLSEDIITILDILKNMDLNLIEEFNNEKNRLIREFSNDNDSYSTIVKAVNYYGILKAIKLGIKKCGNNAFDFENTEVAMLYNKCYFHMLNEAFDFTYEDIKLIKYYNIIII